MKIIVPDVSHSSQCVSNVFPIVSGVPHVFPIAPGVLSVNHGVHVGCVPPHTHTVCILCVPYCLLLNLVVYTTGTIFVYTVGLPKRLESGGFHVLVNISAILHLIHSI